MNWLFQKFLHPSPISSYHKLVVIRVYAISVCFSARVNGALRSQPFSRTACDWHRPLVISCIVFFLLSRIFHIVLAVLSRTRDMTLSVHATYSTKASSICLWYSSWRRSLSHMTWPWRCTLRIKSNLAARSLLFCAFCLFANWVLGIENELFHFPYLE